MIIATAGHVDHGKTSLIRHLTGVDTDRLEEEKRRGLSINLGYAYLPTENKMPLGFIDVPGHQRFINTMISGVSGIDLALLIVAADDGVMPQTSEHLDILQLLGVDRATVVITKVDRVEESRVSEVTRCVENELNNRGIQPLASFPVDNISGDGTEPLRDFLLGCEPLPRTASSDHAFYLSVDRAFNIKGSGLVLTGTVAEGEVSIGDSLRLQPSGKKVRVRGLRVHDVESASASAGQRCAVNVGGEVSLDDVTRGFWLCDPERTQLSERIDVEYSQLSGLRFPLKQFSPIKLHLGARRVAGRVYFLEEDEGSGRRLAQLVLEEPVGAYWGQRFVLRDHAENIVLGGGRIIDPYAIKAKKSSGERLELLRILASSSEQECLQKMLQLSGLVDLERFSWAFNLKQDAVAALEGAVVSQGAPRVEAEGNSFLLSQEHWRGLQADLVEFLQNWHMENTAASGINASELVNQFRQKDNAGVIRALLASELKKGSIRLVDGNISLASHKPRMATANDRALKALIPLIRDGGVHIPLLSELLEATKLDKTLLEKALRDAVRQGILYKVSDRRHALPDDLKNLAGQISAMAAEGEEITVISVKQRFGLGRNLTVEILEYFDSIRFTQRKGQLRVILDASLPERLFAG